MTPLEQQVREALTDEVLQQICSHVFWKRNTSARDVIFAAINPVLTRHAQQVQALTDDVADWMLVADGVKHDWRCQNDAVTGGMKGGTFICLRCQVEALTDERDRARRMVTCLHCIRTAHAGNGWGCAHHRKEIATWATK